MSIVLNKEKIKQFQDEFSVKKEHTILIVDDELANIESLTMILEKQYNIIKARNGFEALDILYEHPNPASINLIISDQRMPGMLGIDFLKETIPIIPNASRIILTGFMDVNDIIDFINKGHIYKFLTKPLEPNELLISVKRALEAHELQMQNIRLISKLKQLNEDLERKVDERTLLLQKSIGIIQIQKDEYRTLVEHAPLIIARLNRDLQHIYVNSAVETIFGLSVSDFIGKTWPEIGFPEYDYPVWEKMYLKVFTTGQDVQFDTMVQKPQGITRYYNIHVLPEAGWDGTVETILIITRDITAQKQSEERFYKTFHANPNLMAIIDMEDRKIIDVNESFTQNIGYASHELVGYSLEKIGLYRQKKAMAKIWHKLMKEGKISNYEVQYCRPDGEKRISLISIDFIQLGNKNCLLVVGADITKKKKFEADMEQLNRLNTVGEMAAAIGHEVRNPMTTVRGYLQMFRNKKQYSEHREQFDTMIEELDRANAIITEFLSLAKNKAVNYTYSNLNEFILALFPLLQADAFCSGHCINLQLSEIPGNFIDKSEMRQLVLNLVRNSFEAMAPGGLVTISTRLEEGSIVLAITDNGPGIPADILAKLGTPFVTTKDKGTGLGLAICYRIAQHHSARVEVQTANTGTSFAIKFLQPAPGALGGKLHVQQ